MTRADVETVEPDPERARDYLAHARRFFEDAERETTYPETGVILYWSTCISAMDAILTAGGRRVGAGEESHAVRVGAAGNLLGAGYRELFERLDEWRRERHGVSYAALPPAASLVAALQADATDVLAAAETFVSTRPRP